MKVDISILLPTRGRTDMLQRSLGSLVDHAEDPGRIEFLLAFDRDDQTSSAWFQQHTAPYLDKKGSRYTAFEFDRLGYLRLNEYVNSLAKQARGDWLFFWGDDAIMESQAWDREIAQVKKFRVLRIPTHNQHPYAIFPIVPRGWFELFGYLSAHQLTDSWVSQIAYIVDIMQDIDVEVTHDRFDLTGNNNDDTYRSRPMLEGKPSDPRDFNYVSYRNQRFADAGRIAQLLRAQGDDTQWWDGVVAGTQDPWAKMCSPERDPNHQVARIDRKAA